MNVYYQRLVATERPCYVCRKATKTVLATLKADDHVYTCEGHLTDPGLYALRISIITDISASPIGPSQEEIDKVVAEEKVRAEIKAAKAKAAADAKAKAASDSSSAEKDDKDVKDETSKEVKRPALPASSGSGSGSPGPSSSTPTSTHKKFALHRGIFAMRQNERKRREQGTQAKAISKGMPQVPRGAF